MTDLPLAEHRVLEFPEGSAVGCSYRWAGGQYCSLNTTRGVVGCGIFDVAIARGTPEHPLREPEDLLDAIVREVSEAAEKLGITPGMTGREALKRMLAT